MEFMEFDKAMDTATGDEGAPFGLRVCERKHEDFKGMEEGGLGPKTKETELRLGLPGVWPDKENHLSENPLSDNISSLQKNSNYVGAKRAFWDTIDGFSSQEGNTYNKSSCLPSWPSKQQPPSSSSLLPNNQNTYVPFKPNLAVPKEPSSVVTEPDVRKPNTSEQRAVVGWPPLRSFRKNFASSSSKPPVEKEKQLRGDSINGSNKTGIVKKGLFVKINMDGVPIGRKIDLHAYDSYQKLAVAVDVLFRGLLAAQNAIDGDQSGSRAEKPITGLLDGSGEYTLVYEDNEGDRMLVGDVPWGMFVNSVRRLRVLKSSDLSGLLVPSNAKHNDNRLVDRLQ